MKKLVVIEKNTEINEYLTLYSLKILAKIFNFKVAKQAIEKERIIDNNLCLLLPILDNKKVTVGTENINSRFFNT